jgi:hypothetical protein
MIRENLLRELNDRFPGRGMRTGVPPDPIAVFPAMHPEVGEVKIWDDGDEATIEIGRITHGHMNPYGASMSEDEVAREVTRQVVEFLEDLFTDRVLLWVSADGRSGGWKVLSDTVETSDPPRGTCIFVWSGPPSPKEQSRDP